MYVALLVHPYSAYDLAEQRVSLFSGFAKRRSSVASSWALSARATALLCWPATLSTQSVNPDPEKCFYSRNSSPTSSDDWHHLVARELCVERIEEPVKGLGHYYSHPSRDFAVYWALLVDFKDPRARMKEIFSCLCCCRVIPPKMGCGGEQVLGRGLWTCIRRCRGYVIGQQ